MGDAETFRSARDAGLNSFGTNLDWVEEPIDAPSRSPSRQYVIIATEP